MKRTISYLVLLKYLVTLESSGGDGKLLLMLILRDIPRGAGILSSNRTPIWKPCTWFLEPSPDPYISFCGCWDGADNDNDDNDGLCVWSKRWHTLGCTYVVHWKSDFWCDAADLRGQQGGAAELALCGWCRDRIHDLMPERLLNNLSSEHAIQDLWLCLFFSCSY